MRGGAGLALAGVKLKLQINFSFDRRELKYRNQIFNFSALFMFLRSLTQDENISKTLFNVDLPEKIKNKQLSDIRLYEISI